MCDNVMEEYNRCMNRIKELMNRDIPVFAIDISSDGNDRWQCPICKDWWYGKHNYCHGCGQRLKY